MVICNNENPDINTLNFEGVTDIHYLVITDDKFEQYWSDLKVKCKEKFINSVIRFIIPIIKSPQNVYNYKIAYTKLIGVEMVGT